MKNVRSGLIWLLVALIGAYAFGMLALSRGEHINAVVLIHWIYERHETNGINREGVGIRGKLY